LSPANQQNSRLRIVFSVKNPDYVRHYDSVLRALLARGHEVELVKHSARHEWPPSVRALAETNDRIRLSTLALANNHWLHLAIRLRQVRFYLRFLDSGAHQLPALLDRARKRAPRAAVWIAESLGFGKTGHRRLAGVVDALESATRSSGLFHEFIRERQPDLIVLTPLVVLKSTQMDLARAAMQLGVRTVFAVASWDHLSSKGTLNVTPQRVFVWNDVQKREAIDLHRVPADRIVVTGCQVFDEWFTRRPSTPRDAFCRRVGLPPDRPILLYVGSSLLEGSPPEAPFILRWAHHLRHSGHPLLETCGILVRPHPRRSREWRGIDLGALTNVVCWPPAVELPVDHASKTDYFDSLHHADAVVGLNTSAMIEAAILGRPVHTVLLPEFRASQEETVHFHYLLDGPDALLRSTRSLEDHARDLAAVLTHSSDYRRRNERFVRRFVRPHGLDVEATTVFVDALESLARASAPPPAPVRAWTHVVRPFMWPFAYAAARRVRRVSEEHRRRKHDARAEHRRRKRAAALDNMGVS
jgi:hypothetical protein